MPVDPELSLVSSLHAGPGTYALLLGSGISVSAGVLSGWEITAHLAGRLAALLGEDAGEDPIAWYLAREGADPDYSQMLTDLAPGPGDRRNLLQRYFEPSEEESESGLKRPTPAHRAIADLVAKGYIRVIVTTNFDRLLEMALSEAGVEAQVISSSAHATGATPISHSGCTIIKVHGDYLSPDLRNTVEELATYTPEMDRLLDDVFDQYGLVVCGWSGIWDTALRNAILRAPNRRYATFWAHRGPLAAEAAELLAHRSALDLQILDADTFFQSVADKVDALAEAIDQRPQTTAVAVAQLKRYLPDEVHRIRLQDLVMGEVEQAIEATRNLDLGTYTPEIFGERVRTSEQCMATLAALLLAGSYFGDRIEHDALWHRSIERLASPGVQTSGDQALLDLRRYPTTIALYAVGIGAVATRRLAPLLRVLAEVQIPDGGQAFPLGVGASPWTTVEADALRVCLPELSKFTPLSDHLHSILRPVALAVIPDDERFNEVFDELEFFLGMIYAHWREEGVGPVGRFVRSGSLPVGVLDRHTEEILAKGLFDGSAETLAKVRDDYVKKSVNQRRF